MLEEMKLDDGSYGEIYEKAMGRLRAQAPWWTHRQVSDPGITLLEMWALLFDMQSFYLDQVQEEHYRKYLKLLGMEPDEGRQAFVWVLFDRVKKDMVLPVGTKLLADRMVFETAREGRLTANHITGLYLGGRDGNGHGENYIRLMNGPRKTAFPLPPGRELFSFTLREAVEPGMPLDFFILLDEKAGRRPAGEGFRMVSLEWEYLTDKGYRGACVAGDGTRGLLYSGLVSLMTDSPMEAEEGGYPVRCLIREGDFDIMPVIYRIYLNAVPTLQQDTLCLEEHAPFHGDAPYIPLRSYLALTGDIGVYARCGGEVWEDFTDFCRITPPVTGEGGGRYVVFDRERFGKVPAEGEDMVKIVCSAKGFGEGRLPRDISGVTSQRIVLPWENVMRGSVSLMLRQGEGAHTYRTYRTADAWEDRYPYVWHWQEGESAIMLGDGRHGEIPKPAKDGLRLTGLVLCEGEEGNVSIGRITRLERPDLFPGIRCKNLMPAKGGRDRQKPSEQFLGVRKRLLEAHRMVTGQDIRELAMKTPGLVLDDVRAEWTDGKVAVTLFPSAPLGRYCGKRYVEEVRKHLEQYRLVGSRMEITVGECRGSGRGRGI